jgi:hypothetical protein
MDDDCIAHPEWLASLAAAYYEREPRPACIGGRVFLRWEGGKRPEWLPDELLSAYGYIDLGEQARPMRHAMGGNMAVDKEILWRYGGFPVALGRIGSFLLAGEESHFQLLLHKAGLLIMYEPKAIVEHWIPRSKQTPQYLYKVFQYLGISESVQRRLDRHVSFAESLKLIVHAIIGLAGDTKCFARSLLQGRNRSQSQILWHCTVRRRLGFIFQEVRFLRGLDSTITYRIEPKP